MVVMKRAMTRGREAALNTRLTLIANNPVTAHLLAMLPDEGAFPTMQHVQQKACEHTLEWLTTLASQCAEAGCQPLEVFTRSVQCPWHEAAHGEMRAKRRTHKGRVFERQQQAPQQHRDLPPSWYQDTEQALQRLGAQQSMAALIVSFLRLYDGCRISGAPDSTALMRVNITHMLPGML